MFSISTTRNIFNRICRPEKLLCFTGIFIFSIIALSACENSSKEIQDLTSKNLSVEEARNVDINYTLGGKARAKLLSALMLRYQETLAYVEFPKKLHVDFYNDSSGVDSRLDAFYGKYFETQSKVYLKDSIRITNTKGDTLYCDELWWDRARVKNEFYTAPVYNYVLKADRRIGIFNMSFDQMNGLGTPQDLDNYLKKKH